MKKRSKLGIIGAAAMAIASAIAPTVASQSSPNTQQQASSTQREAISVRPQAPKPVEQRINFTNGGTGKESGRMLNQRQYRKWMKQVPQMRRSKKCRVK